MSQPRILVAGVGNIFLGDDAFGVEVARRLMQASLPEAVRVVDFGIRGLDLAYALLDGYEAVVMIDAAPRGGQPGTLYVLEPRVDQLLEDESGSLPSGGHDLDPVKVLGLVEALGGRVERLLLVGCEPMPADECDEMAMEMSAPVRAAVDEAVPLIETLVAQLLRGETIGAKVNTTLPEKEVQPCRD